MLAIILSTIAFFVASYFIKRYMDREDIPKGLTRSTMIFTLALAISYGVAVAIDWAAMHWH